MSDALLVSHVALWIVVVLLCAVVVALVRQIGVLHERIAPAGALGVRGGPTPGEPAPVVEGRDWQGRSLRGGGAASGGQSTLLFFLSPTCPVCKTLLPVLESVAAAESHWLRIVLASDGTRDEHADFVRAHRLDRFPYLLSTPLGLAYRVGQLPYAVLIDAGGVVRAAGLVNTREHLESLFEAQERGTVSAQAFLARRGAGAAGAEAAAPRRASGGPS